MRRRIVFNRPEQNSPAAAFFGTILAASLLIGVFVLGNIFWTGYTTKRDVSGYLDRAQVGADIESVSRHLDTLHENMLDYGMDSGHAALIFQTPQNDMGEMFKVVQNLREKRIPETMAMERGSPEYQTALDDIRGICRELAINDYALKYRMRHDKFPFFIGFYAATIATFFSAIFLGYTTKSEFVMTTCVTILIIGFTLVVTALQAI